MSTYLSHSIQLKEFVSASNIADLHQAFIKFVIVTFYYEHDHPVPVPVHK